MTSFLQKAIMFLSPRNAQKEGPIELSYQPEIFKAKKDQEKVFELTRELVNAQFLLGDDELSKRLWEEVANHNLDPEGIINLMYKCYSHNDLAEMIETDSNYHESSK
ncbi:MAG: hypothetical protein QF527_04245 [SAR86 cluster bacterium]|nr:hypothetical protein [SAR86 cluster bacterium]